MTVASHSRECLGKNSARLLMQWLQRQKQSPLLAMFQVLLESSVGLFSSFERWQWGVITSSAVHRENYERLHPLGFTWCCLTHQIVEPLSSVVKLFPYVRCKFGGLMVSSIKNLCGVPLVLNTKVFSAFHRPYAQRYKTTCFQVCGPAFSANLPDALSACASTSAL